jgi:hypothetical protein
MRQTDAIGVALFVIGASVGGSYLTAGHVIKQAEQIRVDTLVISPDEPNSAWLHAMRLENLVLKFKVDSIQEHYQDWICYDPYDED